MKHRKKQHKPLTINPFVSRAQQKACYAKDDPRWDCAEWSAATKKAGKKLPGRKRAVVRNLLRKRQAKASTTNAKKPSKFSANKADPTRTLGMRKAFGSKIKKQFARLKAKIVNLLVQDDAFGLNSVVGNFNPNHGEGGKFSSGNLAVFDLNGEQKEVAKNPSKEHITNWLNNLKKTRGSLIGVIHGGNVYVTDRVDDSTNTEVYHADLANMIGVQGDKYDTMTIILKDGKPSAWLYKYLGTNKDSKDAQAYFSWAKKNGITANFNPFHGVHGLFASADAAGSSTDDPVQDYQNRGVHAKSFKQWFGDWEHDPDNASKVVNDDGTPRATHHVDGMAAPNGQIIRVYHGSAVGGFDAVDPTKLGDDAIYGKGVYFTESKEIAEAYATHDWHSGNASAIKPVVLECYLNIRKPFDCDRPLSDNMKEIAQKYFRRLNMWNERDESGDIISTENPWDNGQERPMTGNDLFQRVHDLDKNKGGLSITTFLQNLGFDGVVRTDKYVPGVGYKEDVHNRTWVAFEPKQVKAVHNKGTFNPNDPNIYNQFILFNKEQRDEIRYLIDNFNPHHGEHGRFATADAPTGPQETIVQDDDESIKRSELFIQRDRAVHYLNTFVDNDPKMVDAQKAHFKKVITNAIHEMPKEAVTNLMKYTKVFRPVVNPTEMRKLLESFGPTGLPDDAKIFGAYNREEQSLNPDGLKSSKEPSYTMEGTVVHEMMHAIDGPQEQFSHTREWYEAAGEEIRNRPDALTQYAASEPAEAFAEFGRALYAKQEPRARLLKEFPLCCQYFKDKGLWPDK